LVELCSQKLPTYFINSADKILSKDEIIHFDIHQKSEVVVKNYIPNASPIRIMLTCGASCPDAVVEEIFRRLVSFFPLEQSADEVVRAWIAAR
jgi:4-hydroxy-3-methylbut-2-enyl diphosphate reductase